MDTRRRLHQAGGTFYARIRRHKEVVDASKAIADGILQVGRETYGTPQVSRYMGSERRVTIGSYCSIGPGVKIITGGNHPSDWVSTFPFRIRWKLPGAYRDGMPYSRGDVVVGSDVWIGTDAVLLSGITIGHGAVIGARAVVNTDVPPYAVVSGNPGQVVRMRFSAEQIADLLKIRWWDWPAEKVRAAVEFLSSSQIDQFIENYCDRD